MSDSLGKPICPKCKKQIRELGFASYPIVFGTICVDGIRQEDTAAPEEQKVEFFCPECCGDLFENEDEALEFLQSGGKLQPSDSF